MPLEGHWERQHTPLRAMGRREVTALAIAVAIVVLVTVVAVVTSPGSSRAAAGCVDVTVPSTTGAARAHACGVAARRLCASPESKAAATRAELRAQCRRLRP
ncbi:MAG: hypothetical protein QOI81_2205 [Actinomycetota bacterium]|jgi:hypothetical protein|nr:hypothetical protein [Actinomycetota bacterium]